MAMDAKLPESPPEEHRLSRDGDRDLAFTGWLLGKAELVALYDLDEKPSRGTTVRIFLTVGRRIITSVEQWDQQDTGRASTCRVATHSTPDEALAWLRKDARGNMLGPASLHAWTLACHAWRGLADEEVERVE